MMEGFFSKKETTSLSRPDGKALSCHACGLYRLCKSPKMKPYGNFKKKIMIIGEAPGEQEDLTGKPFQGKTGQLLQRTLQKFGVDFFEDCISVNGIMCRPMDEQKHNRGPLNFEIDCCRKNVLNVVLQYKPKMILLLGNTAIYSLLKHRWHRDLGGITKWRGWTIPDQDFQCWVCPTFHPSHVEREEGQVTTTIWQQDLKRAIGLLETKEYQDKVYLLHSFPKYVEPKIDVIEDLQVLNSIGEGTEIAFDYETTGLKPHASGHRIVSCAIADSENHAYAFLMPQNRRDRQPFIDLLANPKIRKVAQNMKFEQAWSFVRLRQTVESWEWDTMIATHVMDNRPGVTGLKFQAYVQFGIIDYSSDVDPYLRDDSNKDSNALNRILELLEKPNGKEKLLKYNALDAIYELRLANKQRHNLLPF